MFSVSWLWRPFPPSGSPPICGCGAANRPNVDRGQLRAVVWHSRETIGDFGLADIFQLIGIQRKTGTLTLDRKSETVTIKFLEGTVAGAENSGQDLEDRLGAVLVRIGKISEAQLREALKSQRKTLQRLGHILVERNYISQDDLIDALRVQQLQVVYRLFRWREGGYHFHASDSVDYDEQHFTPISSDTILMEGARMVDEWPLIERRIRSDQMVFRLSDAALALDLDVPGRTRIPTRRPTADFDFDFASLGEGGDAAAEAAAPCEEESSLSEEEREILRLIDGQLNVREIDDRSSLGEFDTYRILSDLIGRQLIEEVERIQPTAARHSAPEWASLGRRLVQGGPGARNRRSVGNRVVHAARQPPGYPGTWSTTTVRSTGCDYSASYGRLECLERALHTFYLDTGEFPHSLPLLAANGYLRPDDLVDPWGQEFAYGVSPGGYQLYAADPSGAPRPELLRSSIRLRRSSS